MPGADVPGADVTGLDGASLIVTKHHGLGNDFLVVFADDLDALMHRVGDLGVVAQRLCDRRRGVGADGLLVGVEAEGFDAHMVLVNADGSRAEMSGNGIRCFAQALARRRGSFDAQRILTDAGERRVEFRPPEQSIPQASSSGQVAPDDVDTVWVTVEMGEVVELPEPHGWASLGAHPDRPVAHLSLGNPHSVVGVDDVTAVDLDALGSKVPHVNLEIVEPGPEPHAVTMRVHERGVGVTEACGTGACAAAWAAVRWGLVAASITEILVHMDGGSATVDVGRPVAGAVTLTGPATYVGQVTLPLATLRS